MASNVTKATAVAIYANSWDKLNNFPLAKHSVEVQQLIQSLTTDIRTLLDTVNTDGSYTIAFTEPRYTIVPYSATRPFKVRAGQALSYTLTKSGGESTAAVTWSAANLPSWITLNSSSGNLSGTAPVVSGSTFNVMSGAGEAALSDLLAPINISCKNAFGEAVNGPLPISIQVVNASTPVVSSAATASGAAAAHTFTTYTITASNTPTSFAAYGLLTGLTLNPATGAISGTLDASVTAGTYYMYVSGINAYGEGEEKLVTITIAS